MFIQSGNRMEPQVPWLQFKQGPGHPRRPVLGAWRKLPCSPQEEPAVTLLCLPQVILGMQQRFLCKQTNNAVCTGPSPHFLPPPKRDQAVAFPFPFYSTQVTWPPIPLPLAPSRPLRGGWWWSGCGFTALLQSPFSSSRHSFHFQKGGANAPPPPTLGPSTAQLAAGLTWDSFALWMGDSCTAALKRRLRTVAFSPAWSLCQKHTCLCPSTWRLGLT